METIVENNLRFNPIFTQEKFPRTENFPKISLLKIENLKIFNFTKKFSDGKFVLANHILQIFLSAENFPEWKWALLLLLFKGTVQPFE
jgi:hypothetical protein